jgi:hypothetical protein
MTTPCLSPEKIIQLAELSESVAQPCECSKRTIEGWESVSSSFPEELLECLGKVSPHEESELTVREYHPNGTNYWSPDAPIALHYFPANRSELWRCRKCNRCFLRYTEFGGYYIDKRIRALRSELLTIVGVPE